MHKSLTLNPIAKLDTAFHNRADFSSGVKQLDDFLKTKARKESPELSLTFVLTSKEEPDRIMGYYSLSSARLLSGDLPKGLMKRIGHYGAVPATLLGRLAVDERFQRSKNLRVGETLLIDAMLKAYRASRSVASFGLIIDVLVSDKVDPTSFYARYGFLKCESTANKMYLPMKTIEQILMEADLV